MLVSWRGPTCLAEAIPQPAHPLGDAVARPKGRAFIRARRWRPAPPSPAARSARSPLPPLVPSGPNRKTVSQSGGRGRSVGSRCALRACGRRNQRLCGLHCRALSWGRSAPHPPGSRLRAGGRAVGAHRPTQPGSAGNRTSAQACAARSALPAPPPWFVHRAPLHRPGPACGRFRGARRWPIQQPAPLRLTWPARAPRLAPSLVAPRAIRAIKAKGAPAGAPLLYHGVPWCTTVYHATRALISAQPHHRNHPCGTAMRPYAPLSGACGASADHHPPRPGRPRRFAR